VNISSQRDAYVSSAVGESVSLVSFEYNRSGERVDTHTGRGGVRGRIKGFSRASRRNLLRHFASINRTAFRAFKGRVFSITLTYPKEWPEDPEACKNHLKSLYKRIKRRFGEFSGFWRMGIQQRGAWHFHVLLFVPSSFGSVRELRRFVASSWYEVCGEVSEGHLLAGTRVEQVNTWKKATSYAERYVAKQEEFPEGLKTGRIWGVWNEELLPIRWKTVKVSLKDAYRIRRIYRKLAKMKSSGSLRQLTVFIRYENVTRLLEFLGYRQE